MRGIMFVVDGVELDLDVGEADRLVDALHAGPSNDPVGTALGEKMEGVIRADSRQGSCLLRTRSARRSRRSPGWRTRTRAASRIRCSGSATHSRAASDSRDDDRGGRPLHRRRVLRAGRDRPRWLAGPVPAGRARVELASDSVRPPRQPPAPAHRLATSPDGHRRPGPGHWDLPGRSLP